MTDLNPLDLAVHRLVSREATTGDIDLLAQRAAAGDDVLGAVLEMARDDAAARAQIGTVLAAAGTVELPALPAAEPVRRQAMRPVRVAAPGWLAAAAVGLIWAVTGLRQAEAPGPHTMPVGYTPTVDEALDQYLETGFSQGRILGELPALMVETRSVDGRAEIVYVRRVLERTVVDEIVEEGLDDGGRVVERTVSPATFARPEDL